MKALRDNGVRVIGEVEFAWRLATCDFLAVTGTNGKTTTTSLLGDMLKRGGVRLGRRPATSERLLSTRCDRRARRAPSPSRCRAFSSPPSRRSGPRSLFSSTSPRITPTGTERFESYARREGADLREPDRATTSLIVNADDPVAMGLDSGGACRASSRSRRRRLPDGGAGLRDGAIVVGDTVVAAVDDIPLAGVAGVEDAVAAAAAASAYGVAPGRDRGGAQRVQASAAPSADASRRSTASPTSTIPRQPIRTRRSPPSAV